MEGKDVVARLLWVTHRGHERMEQSLRERERERGPCNQSTHPTAQVALTILSSPEGCDIFLQSLYAASISLRMSRMEIEFVWRRERYFWLYHCLLVVSADVIACERLFLSVCMCACARV